MADHFGRIDVVVRPRHVVGVAPDAVAPGAAREQAVGPGADPERPAVGRPHRHVPRPVAEGKAAQPRRRNEDDHVSEPVHQQRRIQRA